MHKEAKMQIDIAQLAVVMTTALAPFLPFLVDVSKRGTEEFIKVIAAKGGQAAWEEVETIWRGLQARLGEDSEVEGAAKLLAAKPNDETRQRMLADVLASKLQLHPELVEEFTIALSGPARVQQIVAHKGAWVEQVRFRMKGEGQQKIEASESTVRKIKMDMD
jgi:hypothetical protein